MNVSTFSARTLPLLLALLGAACGSDSSPDAERHPRIANTEEALTKAERVVRYGKIRDACTSSGINGRGYLLAGIAMDETNLCMCWSEATWACKGPNSPDCGGGPVIAGSADGPCSAQQGGLGMFQFDAGTFSDTLAKYGSNVLTIDGQVSHAIDYVVHMVKISKYTTNAETDAKAKQWVNDFNINNATLRDEWIKTVVTYYNGCPEGASCWASRYQTYNSGLQQVLDETGLPFWEGTPDFKGSFSGQSFPFASQPFDLYPGEVKSGYIDLVNDGKQTWKPGEVFLGTTQPRDGKSPLAAADWVSPSRATTVDKATPTGAVGRFSFSVKAPATPGDYAQYFNLVREGVAWFSDAGQGGPPDNQLEVKLTVKQAPPGQGGAAGAGGKSAAGGASGSAGAAGKAGMSGTASGGASGSAGKVGASGKAGAGGASAGFPGSAGHAGNTVTGHGAGVVGGHSGAVAGGAGGEAGGSADGLGEASATNEGGCQIGSRAGGSDGFAAIFIGMVLMARRRRGGRGTTVAGRA
jgi:hypothetical protein